MLQMLAQILHNLRTQQILIFLLERIPFHVDIIVGQLQRILDIVLIGSVKDRSGYVKAKGLGRQAQVDLQHLSDIHTGRHAQRIQYDI